ncbi:MAG: DsbA family protein [Terriglobales bacterium]
MKRILEVAALGACIIALGCGGGGSHPNQTSQPPPTPAVLAGSHILGDADAKVTMVTFCDFQCPYCKSFYTDTEWQIVNEYVKTGKAKIAFRHFPLSIHQNAQMAAQAAECAAKVGGNDAFWKYHDTLFTKGRSDGTGLEAPSLKQYAADLQLDTATFNTCLDKQELAAIVSKDSADGEAAGVRATPTFFINGKSLVGALPFSSFKAAIDAQL